MKNIMKPSLELVSKSKDFKRDSTLGLLNTQAELLKFMIKVTDLIAKEAENKMNQVKDLKVYKDLDRYYKLTALKALDLSDKLEVYEYHHGKTKEFIETQVFYDQFLIEQEDLMTQFFLSEYNCRHSVHDWMRSIDIYSSPNLGLLESLRCHLGFFYCSI
jgi:hypothetical protein